MKLLAKSVFRRADEESAYRYGKCLRDKCVGGNERGVFETDEDFGSREKRRAVCISTSPVDYLSISVTDNYILFYLNS